MPLPTIQQLNNVETDSRTIESVVNSPLETTVNRNGVTLTTIAGFNKKMVQAIIDAGYKVPVLYQAGLDITDITQTVEYNGEVYSPKFEELPFETSGTFETSKFRILQGVTKLALSAENGGNIIGFEKTNVNDKLKESISILDCGGFGDGATANNIALSLAKTKGDLIRFPRVNNSETTYIFNNFASDFLDGLTFESDLGVTLSFSESQYRFFKNLKMRNDIKVHFRDASFNYNFVETEPAYINKTTALPPSSLRRRRIALDCTDTRQVNLRGVDWPTGDIFTASTGTKVFDYININASSGKFQGPFVELGAYETVSSFFENGFVGPIGVIIRGRLGYTIIYAGNETDDLISAVKLKGLPISGNVPNLPWGALGQGRYDSFAPNKSIWSVTKIEAAKVVVKLNGKAVTAPYATEIGDIFEVGFVCFGAQFGMSGWTLERRTDAILGMQKLDEISLWGDSTVEALPSSWDKYIKPLMDGLYGVKVGNIVNNAISGQNISQQLALMKLNGFGTAYYVFVGIGTNDVQGSTNISNFHDDIAEAIDFIKSNGRKPVIIPPWMWYTQAQSGGVGQASSNYNLGARYRMVMERVAYEKGAILIKLNEELPNPDPLLLLTEPDSPLLRDNIHQASKANQLQGIGIVKGVCDDYFSMPDTIEEIVSDELMLGTAIKDTDLRIIYTKEGSSNITGSIILNGMSAGQALMRLPRYISPTHTHILMGMAMSSSVILGAVRIAVDPVSSSINLMDMPVGTVRITLSGAAWKSADSA